MNAQELIKYLNTTYGMHKPWPSEGLRVSPATYGYACDYVIKKIAETEVIFGFTRFYTVFVGTRDGILFKNIELILGDESDL